MVASPSPTEDLLAENLPQPVRPPQRLLMGPGPTPVPATVQAALSAPTVGHLDPYFLRLMDETRAMLRRVFGTENRLTLPISGTGTAGMETLLANLIESDDRVLVGVAGVFGGRIAECARRLGAEVDIIEVPWGTPLDPQAFRDATAQGPYSLIALVHAETSTGVLQDLSPFRAIADQAGALLLVDCVTSLGGCAVDLDRHGVDAAFSGSQKCLGCPPGLAPISLSARAVQRIEARKGPPPTWYFDLSLIGRYWNAERAYHHTAPVQMIYGLHESLRLCLEEGLDARFARHRHASDLLRSGLEALGLSLPVDVDHRLPQLTVVSIPTSLGGNDKPVDEKALRRTLLERFGVEIGGGLGAFAGKAWRIGTMSEGATERAVTLTLGALGAVLKEG